MVLLQEVWSRQDYEFLKTTLNYSTSFNEMNPACYEEFSVLTPIGCSGLALLSRYPLEYISFLPYDTRGNFWSFDGEYFVHKGIGRARIRLADGIKIDLFTTHLAHLDESVRLEQTSEIAHFLDRLDQNGEPADVKIFAGDVNSMPHGRPYNILTSLMKDSLMDRYPEIISKDSVFATYNNRHNTYADGNPERIDYLMYWAGPHVALVTSQYTMPILRTINSKGRAVSLSDHEALSVEFIIEK